jgi:hypothetical protein
MFDIPKIFLGALSPNPEAWDYREFPLDHDWTDQNLESRTFYGCRLRIPSEKSFRIEVKPENFIKGDSSPDFDFYIYQRYYYTDGEIIWLPLIAKPSIEVKEEAVVTKESINRELAILLYFYALERFKSAKCRITCTWAN